MIFSEEMIKERALEMKNGPVPQIVLNGWWWKKYFKKYREKRERVQCKIDKEWKGGDMVENIRRMQVDMLVLGVHPPIYVFKDNKDNA